MTIFIRAVATEDKAAALRQAIAGHGDQTFILDLNEQTLPGTPFSYWVGKGIRSTFQNSDPVESDTRQVRVGLQTSNDPRFLRAIWEVAPDRVGKKWFPFAKGGELSPFYAPIHLIVDWENSGHEIKSYSNLHTGKPLAYPRSESLYFRKGLTWPLRASRFAPQPLPVNSIFSVRGYSIFLPERDILSALALFNSRTFDYIFKALLGRFSYPEFIVGVLQKLPWPNASDDQRKELEALSKRAWCITMAPDTANETSTKFSLPRSLNTLARQNGASELALIYDRIDTIALNVLGLGESDALEIEAAKVFKSSEIVLEQDSTHEETSGTDDTSSLISWAVGVAFGRFDARLATGQRSIPMPTDPFEAISPKSPGMRPDNVEKFRPVDGILVDDMGHRDDLSQVVLDVVQAVGMEEEAKDVTDGLRDWLALDYFKLHIAMYSKSGRKAPIWWQLSTPSASYSIWFSYHDLTKDTLYRAINDYVRPKLAHERSRLDATRVQAGVLGDTSIISEELDRVSASIENLQAMLDELGRVAPLWSPDLNDGVTMNFALLWRLVPQNKAWQRVLREVWNELCAGKHDWTHLAMRLWPERVVPKCVTDRSLAIAHGLEELFWLEDKAGKWKPRHNQLKIVEQLIAERTSAAVTEALKSLLEAPEPVAIAKRVRRTKR